AEYGSAAARRETEGIAGRHRSAATTTSRHEHRLLHLEEPVATLVRARSVNPESDSYPCIEELAHRRHAGAEAQVRAWTVSDAGARRRKEPDLAVREPHAVSAPDVACEPPELLEVLGRPAAVELSA